MSIAEISDVPVIVDFTESNQENSPLIDQLSQPLVGKWNVLVSQTNWEKGTLILSWRNELIAAGLPNTVYSDEAWARLVGNVSAQHVGRLRRVSERFGERHRDFVGLYWSHFHAVLDWDDAELWLEGAVQNDWSVAQMRSQRWESIGASDEHKPQAEDIIVAEFDEDAYSPQSAQEYLPKDRVEARIAEIGAANAIEGFDASSIGASSAVAEPPKKKEQSKKEKAKSFESESTALSTGELLMSLKGISDFPADFAEPLELLKVAILSHKLAGWKAISAEQVRQTLETLKMLAVSQESA